MDDGNRENRSPDTHSVHRRAKSTTKNSQFSCSIEPRFSELFGFGRTVMPEIAFLPRDFITRVEQWLGGAIINLDDIKLIVESTGVSMGKIELEGTPEVRWNKAIGRIVLEGRFHLLLNRLALYAPNADYISKIQEFSIEYDRCIANSMATDVGSLQKELDDLIKADESRSLAMLGIKIRESVRIIRAQIDDDQLWLSLPFTTSGYAAEDARDELSACCLRVVAAADALIHETRILADIIDDSLTQDPETSVRRRRQQLVAMTHAKLTLAEKGRTLIKTVRATTPLTINPSNHQR